jgi:hypothetical protein
MRLFRLFPLFRLGSGSRGTWLRTWAAMALAAAIAAPAGAAELLTNGGFETGDFTGWNVSDLADGSGSFFIDDADGFTPFSFHSTVGPASGAFYAVSDQGGPGTHALIQNFFVPGAASSVVLTFDMFVNDWDGGPIVDPIGLDHQGPPNQHARVDLLSAAAGDFDTGAGVLANFYLGVDPGADPNPYTPYLFDITSLVGGGGAFRLRFAETDNQLYLNQGLDDVSIQFTAAPEPSTLALVAAGLAVVAAHSRRRRA